MINIHKNELDLNGLKKFLISKFCNFCFINKCLISFIQSSERFEIL